MAYYNDNQQYGNQPQGQQPYGQQQVYGQQAPNQPTPPKPDNNLVWAILSTLCCCLPLGIVSIFYAAKVDSLYRAGLINEAYDASANARKWAIISLAVGLVVDVIYFIVEFGFGMLALSGY